MTRRIKTLAVAAVLAVTAAGCATTRPGGTSATPGNDNSGGSGSAASCIAMLKFHHLVYEGTSLRTHPPYNHYGVIPLSRLHRIGVAVLPPCVDTNYPGIDDTPAAVQVARIDGVSPAIAIAALPRGEVYLRAGAKLPRTLTTARWIHRIFSD